MHYQVRVRGRLSKTLLGAFPELRAQVQGSQTLLAGQLPDQAALSACWTGSKRLAWSCWRSSVRRMSRAFCRPGGAETVRGAGTTARSD